jgi:hypothetical protein
MAGNNYHEATLRRLLRETPVTLERMKKAFGSNSMGRWATIAVLLGLLALSARVGYGLWSLVDIDMPAWAWVALGFGVGLSLLVGFGLMALLFYSSRMGYDEPARALDQQEAGD